MEKLVVEIKNNNYKKVIKKTRKILNICDKENKKLEIISNGKLITPGTVPINNNSVIFLPEITDTAMFSTVNLKCFGIISSYLTFIRRMRHEGIYY